MAGSRFVAKGPAQGGEVMNQDQAAQLQQLVDRAEIESILTTYPRAIDRLDVELLRSLYHPDASEDHANFHGSAQEFAEYAIAYLREHFTATMHHVTHSHIAVQDDEAAAESYYYGYHLLEGDEGKVADFFGRAYADRCAADATIGQGHVFICAGRYLDRLSRRGGSWRIASREITVEWKHFHPASRDEQGAGIAAIVAPPRRGPDDAAYRIFAEIGR